MSEGAVDQESQAMTDDEREFLDAFNEDDAPAPQDPADDKPEATDDDTPDDGAGDGKGDDKQDDGGEGEAPGPDDQDTGTEGQGSDDQPSDDPEDWKARFGQLEQNTRSWAGRLSASDRRNQELQAELESLKEQIANGGGQQQPTGQGQQPPSQEQADDAKAVLNEFYEEYPSLQKPLETMIADAKAEVRSEFEAKYGELKQTVDPILQQQQQDDEAAHWDAIAQTHSDYLDISNDVHAWAETLPTSRTLAAQAVLANGSAQDVIGLLTEYKTENGLLRQKQQSDQRRQQQARDAEAVRGGRSGGPPANLAQPDPDDFDAAFDEAIANDPDFR